LKSPLRTPGKTRLPYAAARPQPGVLQSSGLKPPIKESAFHPGLKSGVSMKVHSYKAILLTPDLSLGPEEHRAMTLTPGLSLGPEEHRAMTLTPGLSLGPEEHKGLTPDFSLGILKTLMNYSPGFSPE